MATLAMPSSSGYPLRTPAQAPSMAPTSSSHSSTGTKLRSHLLSLLPLLPKHALFHAKLTIHEVASVPFLDGEFAAKWRFKNAHSLAGAAATANANNATVTAGQSTGSLVERSAERLRRMGSFGSLRGQSEPVLEERGEDSPESSSSSSDRGGRTTPMPGDRPHSRGTYGAYLTPSRRPALSAAPSYYQNPQPAAGNLNFVSLPKGQTPYVPLRKHAAGWSLDVDAAVQMSIGRAGVGSEPCTPGLGSPATGMGPGEREGKEPGWLQPSELKLTVIKYLHEWERKDELAKEGMVLGTVVVNLAEYVGEGVVTRRYLLRDSKTNATLKLSIELTQIGGETRYRSPPLQKGQILGSVAGLMSDDHLRRHARSPLLRAASSGSSSSSLYLPAAQGAISHQQGLSPAHPPAGHRRTPSTQSMPVQPASSHLAAPSPRFPPSSYASPSQPFAHSSASPYSPASPSPGSNPQSTELIIEALFNPFPTQSTSPSPFTYYKPPPPLPGPADPAAAAADGSEVGDGDEGEGTGGEGSTADESGRGAKRRWWRSKVQTGGGGGNLKGGRPGELDLRGAKARSDVQLSTPGPASAALTASTSTVTPGTARAATQTGKWKWRTPQG